MQMRPFRYLAFLPAGYLAAIVVAGLLQLVLSVPCLWLGFWCESAILAVFPVYQLYFAVFCEVAWRVAPSKTVLVARLILFGSILLFADAAARGVEVIDHVGAPLVAAIFGLYQPWRFYTENLPATEDWNGRSPLAHRVLMVPGILCGLLLLISPIVDILDNPLTGATSLYDFSPALAVCSVLLGVAAIPAWLAPTRRPMLAIVPWSLGIALWFAFALHRTSANVESVRAEAEASGENLVAGFAKALQEFEEATRGQYVLFACYGALGVLGAARFRLESTQPAEAAAQPNCRAGSASAAEDRAVKFRFQDVLADPPASDSLRLVRRWGFVNDLGRSTMQFNVYEDVAGYMLTSQNGRGEESANVGHLSTGAYPTLLAAYMRVTGALTDILLIGGEQEFAGEHMQRANLVVDTTPGQEWAPLALLELEGKQVFETRHDGFDERMAVA